MCGRGLGRDKGAAPAVSPEQCGSAVPGSGLPGALAGRLGAELGGVLCVRAFIPSRAVGVLGAAAAVGMREVAATVRGAELAARSGQRRGACASAGCGL